MWKTIEQKRAYELARWHRLRREWLKGKSCAFCGSRKLLEVDHIDPRRKITHRVWNRSKKMREAELAKCQALCRKCHREKTDLMRVRPPKHGTVSGYVYYRCRCDNCRAAISQYRKQFRKVTIETLAPQALVVMPRSVPG